MINFSLTRDNNNRIKAPDFLICNPNYKKIDIVSGSKLKNSKVSLLLNGKSTITFEYDKFYFDEDGNRQIDNKYKLLVKRNTVLWKDNSWFIITKADELDDGNGNKYKEVTFTTCDEELSRKTLTDIGNYNNIEDEDTSEEDVNLYALYDPSDVNHSCIHIALTKLPDWELNYLDPLITSNKHTFCIDSIKVYDFLTQEVAKSFNCLILFDTLHKKINCFSYENPIIMKQTGVYLSYSNLIKNYQLTESEDIVTSLRCYGGDNGFLGIGNVDIAEVNMGSNYLNDYTYVYDQFSDGLKAHYTAYKTQYLANSEIYASYTNDLTTLYEDYYNLIDKSPNVIGSTDWTQYGLNQLQTEYDSNNLVVSTYLSLNGKSEVLKSQYDIAVNKKIAIEYELAVRNKQIDAKLVEIQSKITQMNNCRVDVDDYLTEDEQIELSRYTYEEDYNDSSFVTYDTMSGSEALEVKKDFLSNCLSELKRVSKPRFELELELHNLYTTEEFKNMADELSLGCVAKVNPDVYMQEENISFDIRLTKIEFSFDVLDSITVTFSSKKLLDEFYMEDIFKMAESSQSYVSFNNTSIKNATSQTKITKDFVTSNLNALNNKFMSTDDAEVVQHAGGIDIRKKNKDTGLYYPEGMKLTYGGLIISDDSFKTSKTAIGQLILPDGSTSYGIVAETIMGKLLIGNELNIINDNLTFKVDTNGLTLTNGTNTIFMNPNDNKLFRILKGTTEKLYLGADGEIYTYANITGGSLNIGNGSCTISNSGHLYCSSADIQGKITAESGWISGFDITNYELQAGSGTKYIRLSPIRSLTSDGGTDSRYASIDLGKYGNDTIIHLRSDGYCRFGLAVLDGSVKFNYTDASSITYPFYTKNLKINQDGLITVGSLSSTDYGFAISSTKDMTLMCQQQMILSTSSTVNVECSNMYVNSSKVITANILSSYPTKSEVQSMINSAISSL